MNKNKTTKTNESVKRKMCYNTNVNRQLNTPLLLSAIVMIFAVFIFSTSVSSALLHGFPYSADIGITLLNQDPDPVEPGKYVDIRFMLENYGESAAQNITLVVIPKYPFSLDDESSAEQTVGRLGGMQMSKESTIVKYKLRVDKNALDGVYPIKLKFKTSNEKGFVEIENINISVKTRNLRLLIDSTEIVPERISPGESAEIVINL